MLFETTYFENPGEQNTDETLKLSIEAARRVGARTLVVASRTGTTARALVERVDDSDGLRVVVITPQYGWHDEHEFDLSLIPVLNEKGHIVHTGSMPFHSKELHGGSEAGAMAGALRIFGHGTEVCVEIALMAVDGGHLEAGEQCVLIAGTRRGADTAIIASPASTLRFNEFAVHEFVCRPSLRKK